VPRYLVQRTFAGGLAMPANAAGAKVEDAAEARRLGGIRCRREHPVGGAYEFEGFGTIESILRVLDIAMYDVLTLEKSIVRSGVIIRAAGTALKVLEVSEVEARLAALESAVRAPRDDDGRGGLLAAS
jgi:hypothetical protein